MKKLIELGVAIDIAIGAADEYDGGYNFERDRKIRDALMAFPTVDAAPVVRCKDCTHWSGRKYNVHINGFLPWCRFSALQREANDYCSYGERKDGENGKTD